MPNTAKLTARPIPKSLPCRLDAEVASCCSSEPSNVLARVLTRLRIIVLPAICLVPVAMAHAATDEISEPFQGVRLIHSISTVPRLVDMYVVEIDMTAPGLSFLVSPSNGALPGEATPQTTRDFISQVGAQIGINGSFYDFADGGQLDVLGLAVSNGDTYSQFERQFSIALNISPDNVATIFRAPGRGVPPPPTSIYNAVSGNLQLVTDGFNTAVSSPIEPRTAVGVTGDGKLLLFTV